MVKDVDITVLNKLKKEKRDINIYHHADKNSNLISYNCSFHCRIQPACKDDYLHISLSSGPGDLLDDCILDLPSFMDFKFLHQGEITLVHSGTRTMLKVPHGPPAWQLKMTIPKPLSFSQQTVNGNYITIGDIDDCENAAIGDRSIL